MRRVTVRAAALFCLVSLASSVAAGQALSAHDTEAARAHHAAGVDYFERGRYADAAQQFREAFEISGRAHLWLNVSRAHELGGQPGPAAEALERYLAAQPDAPDRAALQDRIRMLREQAMSAPTEAPAEAPAETPAEAPAEADAVESPVPAPPVPSQPDMLGPALLFTGAGVTLLTAVITGSVAIGMHDSVAMACGTDDLCPASEAARIDTGAALALTTDVLFGVTGALVVGGVIWLVVAASGGAVADSESARPTFGCGPDGCTAGLRGSFR